MAQPASFTRKVEQLETLFNQYKDLAREVIIKEDLLCEGVAVAPGTGLSSPLRKSLLLQGGQYKLFRLIVKPPVRDGSPYMVDLAEGLESGWMVLKDRGTNTVISPIREFPIEPNYTSRTFPDGTRYGDIVRFDGLINVIDRCQAWGDAECKFCDVNGQFRLRHPGGAESAARILDPKRVGEAVFECYAREDWPPKEKPINIMINGGSIVGTINGLKEEDFYLQYVDAVVDRLHNFYPTILQMLPKSTEVETRLRDRGVSVRMANLEVWDKDLFAAICPGKAAYMDWESWVRWLADASYVYTDCAVTTDLVVGVEVAEPMDAKSIKEAVDSTAKGFNYIMAHGTIVRPVHWQVQGASALAGRRQPPLEYFLETDRKWYEAWIRHRAQEPHGYIMGIGRNRFPHSAAWDVGRGGPPEYALEWDQELFGPTGFRIPTGSSR